ncbi:flavin reductase family protein [Micromonospora ureilytica]|uniref:flavin reductase family protein n=1 Tax=Micromonospora ureilytica TaxID=709868 RepID=UPI004039829F
MILRIVANSGRYQMSPAPTQSGDSMLRELPATHPRPYHRLLGPRPVYFIGSSRPDGKPHLCAATNVTSISSDPALIAVALWPEWETTANVRRSRRLTVSLALSDQVASVLTAGHRYSGITLPTDSSDKFTAAGLTPLTTVADYPAGVAESAAVLVCDVVEVVTGLGDHDVVIAKVRAAWVDPESISDDLVLDLTRRRPLLQLTGAQFATAQPMG